MASAVPGTGISRRQYDEALRFPRNCDEHSDPGFGCQGQLIIGCGRQCQRWPWQLQRRFVSLKMADWNGVTMQSNFTWSKAMGTGALIQATSEYTPNDAV